ncbi:unnamed protein product, partial [Allacma fusca]
LALETTHHSHNLCCTVLASSERVFDKTGISIHSQEDEEEQLIPQGLYIPSKLFKIASTSWESGRDENYKSVL